MIDIVFSSTTQLATAIRTRHISASETMQAHLAQFDKHNPALNAIHIIDAEKAMERAQAADDALARGEVWGPLHGVPFTLKDAHSTAGIRTTVGFPPFADYVPTEDSTVTARLKRAGGVLIGKSNVPLLLADFQTNNPVFGRTNNPWNVDRTPGGSSGGAAAALASGMTPFDIWHRSFQFDPDTCAFLWRVRPEANRATSPVDWTVPQSSRNTARHSDHVLYRTNGARGRGSGADLFNHRGA